MSGETLVLGVGETGRAGRDAGGDILLMTWDISPSQVIMNYDGVTI